MKKTVKIISIVLYVILSIAIMSNIVFAVNPADISINEGGSGATEVQAIGGTIVGYIRIVGSLVAVAMIVIIGVKYMAASAEGKAEYKKNMIPYLVGAVLVFAGSQIAGIVYNSVNSIGGAV